MKDFKDLLSISSKQELEQLGSSSNIEEIHQLFSLISKEKQQVDRILPIIVGMHQGIFYQLLETLSSEEETLFKDFGSSEPLLHKLAMLAHNWKEDLEALVKQIHVISCKITELNLNQITKQEIFSIKQSIDDLDHYLEEHLAILNRALTLAWNSKRIDLIDNLSTLKDLYLRTASILIGQSRVDTANASGLYKKLEDRLNQVYSFGSELSFAPFKDSDSSLEALTSFGIFYFEDYYDLGLLPNLASREELKKLLRKKTLSELSLFQEKLLSQVEKNLVSLGLPDVTCLKEAKIYSKEILKEYINKYRALLNCE
ncbi:hypothetical protein PHSC3_002021 [Chlamydiales bacterium STE3]|nr:hypothetical protein PHSC3_002021 [Chlamydiales bacterium STE3]